MNHSLSDATAICDKISLDIFSEIQPHGVMLILDKYDLSISYYSANIDDLLHTSPRELLSHSLAHFLKIPEDDIFARIEQNQKKYKSAQWHTQNKIIKIWTYTHQIDDYFVVEIELNQGNESNDEMFELIQKFSDMSFLSRSDDVEALSHHICKEIQNLTDYDRVIIYRFEKKNNGIVLGEAIKNKMESFLGLRFPASDVPNYVRQMYLQQALRYIPTIQYNSVNLIPVKPLIQKKIDLSYSLLRSVAPVHLQYIHNMGGAAALSVAIVYNEKLWGLISCQHKIPKYLSPLHRIVLTIFSSTLARRLAALEYNQTLIKRGKIIPQKNIIADYIIKHNSIEESFKDSSADLLKMLSAQGVALLWQNNLMKIGKTPDDDQINHLINWLYTTYRGKTFATHSLFKFFPESNEYKKMVCGILAVPITPEDKNYFLIFREEFIQTLIWAGNPCKVLTGDSANYSPRHSFEKWVETLRDQALPWDTMEIKAAEYIRSVIANRQLQHLLQEQATHDTLTTLLNRRSLLSSLAVELVRAERNASSLSIILLDIDHFKVFNDKYGHPAGDEILIGFAKFLKTHIRTYDYAYRFGGEEFLLILPNLSQVDALKKAELIRQEVNNLKVFYQKKALPRIYVSLGVANYPTHRKDGKTLIALADEALYQAKLLGRNQVVVA